MFTFRKVPGKLRVCIWCIYDYDWKLTRIFILRRIPHQMLLLVHVACGTGVEEGAN